MRMKSRLVKRTLRLVALLIFCVLTFAVRCHNLRDVFIDGRVYFVDPDCYSRMTRARMVAEHPGMIVRHHDFENHPQGVKSHTTAPLDYLIVAGKTVMDAGFAVFDSGKTSVLHGQTLDLAGALVGPLLGVLGAVFLAVWAWALRLRFWGMALLLYAVCPILVHGTLLGRPDHQALLVVLLMVAVGAEIALARKAAAPAPSDGGSLRSWGMVSGVAWALSLWVSFYEPLILLGVVLVLWLALDRRALFAPPRRAGWITFAAILAVAFLLEGWRIETPDAAMREYFGRWKASIGELAHLDLRSPMLFRWLGWTVLAAPLCLILRRKSDRVGLPLLALFVVTLGLTVWQIRWGYFLAAVFVLALPIFMPAWRKAWVAWLVFVIALWPVAQDWDARLFPNAAAQQNLAMKRAEAVALRSIVSGKTGENGGPFLAPWWLSPSIAYWTGQPGVAGSSHESLPGTVDAARVYLAADAEAALPILRARGVAWILSDAPERVVPTSAALLGVAPPEKCLAQELARHFREEPWSSSIIPETGLARPLGNDFFQVWRVQAEPAAASVPAP